MPMSSEFTLFITRISGQMAIKMGQEIIKDYQIIKFNLKRHIWENNRRYHCLSFNSENRLKETTPSFSIPRFLET